jgi:hypothetical protein
MSIKSITLTFENGKRLPAITVTSNAALAGLAYYLDLPSVQGAIAIVGGAAGLDEPEEASIREKLLNGFLALADFAEHLRLAIVDGGTISGSMSLFAEARELTKSSFPYIGVSPKGRVRWGSEGSFDATPLDNRHTAFVLVESDQWGGEAEILAEVTHTLAGSRPAIEILVNGGLVSRHDVQAFIRRGGNLIVLAGSGRFADEIALAMAGNPAAEDVRLLLETNRVHLLSLDSPPHKWSEHLASVGKWKLS